MPDFSKEELMNSLQSNLVAMDCGLNALQRAQGNPTRCRNIQMALAEIDIEMAVTIAKLSALKG